MTIFEALMNKKELTDKIGKKAKELYGLCDAVLKLVNRGTIFTITNIGIEIGKATKSAYSNCLYAKYAKYAECSTYDKSVEVIVSIDGTVRIVKCGSIFNCTIKKKLEILENVISEICSLNDWEKYIDE